MNAFSANQELRLASRLPAVNSSMRISATELICLLACGAMTALAAGFLHMSLRIPGHAILRGVLPMAVGMALVPRWSSGMLMSIGAGVTAAGMSLAGVGRFPPASLIGILALGPVLDFALLGAVRGWRLYARFALAGAIANLIAFAARFVISIAGLQLAGGRQFQEFWSVALVSFILCGTLAGLINAVICFRSPSGR